MDGASPVRPPPAPPVRPVIVIQHYPPYIAGAERQAEVLAPLLARQFGACDVITTRFRRDLPTSVASGDVTVRRLPTAAPRAAKLLVNAVVAFVWVLLHGRRYTHFLVSNLSPFALGAVAAARLLRRPVLLKPSTLGPDGEIARSRAHLLGPLIWRVFRSATWFVAESELARQEIVGHGIAPARVTTLTNVLADDWLTPPDPALRARTRAELGLGDDTLAVLFVGRLAPGKGLGLLLEAFAAAASDSDAVLLLVGDGPERDAVAQHVRKTGLDDRVRLLGWQAQPRRYYLAADIFAFASQSENFANVLAEAMASGLAIVTTPVGIAAAELQDGHNALIVPHDIEGFAGRLRTLLQDPARRRALGASARADAAAMFGAEQVAARYWSVLATAPGDSRRAR